MNKKKSSLLTKYKYLYEKNPRSKVFAPLAETYRKLGMLPEATKILRDGIKIHPTYVLAYIVLGNIYYDEGHYELAYSTVRGFVALNLENIALQKLFGKVCLELSKYDEALDTYKMMLLINPKDEDIIEKVQTLESKLNYSVIIENEVVKAEDMFDDEDDWVQVDFNKKSIIQEKNNLIEMVQESSVVPTNIELSEEEQEEWSMSTPNSDEQELNEEEISDSISDKIDFENIQIQEHDLSSEFFYEDYDNKSEEVILPEEDNLVEKIDIEPKIISHTLIDLYHSQGHLDKAIELLKEALSEAPDDLKAQEKLASFEKQLKEEKSLDEMIDKVDTSKLDLKKSYEHFLKLIKEKASEIQHENTYN